MSFWDSSAIVPLCINEFSSHNAQKLSRRLKQRYVWREAPVEIASAFARRLREGTIDENALLNAEKRLKMIESRWNAIGSNSRQLVLARTFPRTYGIRALDSLQLAAALVWCKEFPKNKDFV